MDPEQAIAGYRWRFDPETLREVLDEADTALFHRVRAGLTAELETAGDGDADLRASTELALAEVLRRLAR